MQNLAKLLIAEVTKTYMSWAWGWGGGGGGGVC